MIEKMFVRLLLYVCVRLLLYVCGCECVIMRRGSAFRRLHELIRSDSLQNKFYDRDDPCDAIKQKGNKVRKTMARSSSSHSSPSPFSPSLIQRPIDDGRRTSAGSRPLKKRAKSGGGADRSSQLQVHNTITMAPFSPSLSSSFDLSLSLSLSLDHTLKHTRAISFSDDHDGLSSL